MPVDEHPFRICSSAVGIAGLRGKQTSNTLPLVGNFELLSGPVITLQRGYYLNKYKYMKPV